MYLADFWLGLEHVHAIVTDGNYELLVIVKDINAGYKQARYSEFSLAGEDDGYRLSISGYKGFAGECEVH